MADTFLLQPAGTFDTPDYGGGGSSGTGFGNWASSFDWGGLVGNILGGTAAIVNATQGNNSAPGIVQNPNGSYSFLPSANTGTTVVQQAPQNNTWIWVLVIALVLLLVLGGTYFITRKK